MSVKRKSIVSWEEQAFAEDSRGPLGGFIWPPRSYSCSFCGREFRSAQALGGHMNVHRREKVKLNQTVNKNHNQESLEHNICDNNLVLGFDLDSCWNIGGNKRQKTNHVTQVIMDGGLDLELRLA